MKSPAGLGTASQGPKPQTQEFLMQAPDIIFPNLGIHIQDLPRALVTVGGFSIYFYGFLIAIGIMLCVMISSRQARLTGQNPSDYVDFLLWALIGGVIGGRLHFVAFSWEYYSQNLGQILNLRGGGLGFYGAILVPIGIFIIYSRKKKLDTLLFLDTALPTVLIGQALGRWGNFFDREAYGQFTDNPFAMAILLDDVRGPITTEMTENIISYAGAQYIQVHPTFLYESIYNVIAFGLITFLYRRYQKFKGEIALSYFVLYGLGRFFIEGLRADQLLIWGTSLAASQVLSAVLFLVSATLIIIGRHRAQKA